VPGVSLKESDCPHHHLVINTALVKPETIAGIVKEVIGRKS
jgi:hypothetical protein